MTISLRELQESTHRWRKANFAPGTITPKHQLLGVVEEVGELSHSILKMEQEIRGSKAYHMGQAADSVGDIVIFLAGVCSTLDLDLEECVEKTWDEVSKRNWVENPDTGIEDERTSGAAGE
jgi:NTP pyrophosphatase (non-canonical NTP hydrolase)